LPEQSLLKTLQLAVKRFHREPPFALVRTTRSAGGFTRDAFEAAAGHGLLQDYLSSAISQACCPGRRSRHFYAFPPQKYFLGKTERLFYANNARSYTVAQDGWI
jgi:hypothetical protein